MDGVWVVLLQWSHAVDRLTYHVEHPALHLLARRHTDRSARGRHFQTALQSVGIVHSDSTHGILADVLLHLYDEVAAVGTFYDKGIMDFRQHFLCILSFCVEIHIDNRTNNLRDVSNNLRHNIFAFKVIFPRLEDCIVTANLAKLFETANFY